MEGLDFSNVEGIVVAILVAVGGVLTMGLKWGWNKLEKMIAESKNKVDDAMLKNIKQALTEIVEEGKVPPPPPPQ